jgi:NAD(P)-dependent dehydrogenase (short-subunit alcohol dehydrogenase family)
MAAWDQGLVQIPDRWFPSYIAEHSRDMTGQVAVITGSNSGTGYLAAAAMAQMGAIVVMACRSSDKAEAAKRQILAEVKMLESQQPINPSNIVVMKCDNMSLTSVRTFAVEFRDRFERLDFLLLNAGIMAQPLQTSEDGQDIQLQTNHLAHFLLAKELWPTLLQTTSMPNDPLQKATPRVVCHSSSVYMIGWAKFDPKNIESPPHGCGMGLFWRLMPHLVGKGTDRMAWKRYHSSKLAVVAFMRELADRLQEGLSAGQRPPVLVVGAHPGYASTALQKKAGDSGNAPNWEKQNRNAQSAADGSLPMLMPCLLTEAQLSGEGLDGHVWRGGEFLGPSGGNMSLVGPPGRTSYIGGFGDDRQQRQAVWEYSERVCGEFKVGK